MRVFEAMTKEVKTVPLTMSASDAYDLMRGEHIHHLVVLRGGRATGVVSARDVASHRRERGNGVTVADVMTTDVATIGRNETLTRAANMMRGRTIGCLPVTDHGRVVGIVTTSDLLSIIGKGGDRPPRPDRRVLSHRVPHKKAHVGAGRW